MYYETLNVEDQDMVGFYTRSGKQIAAFGPTTHNNYRILAIVRFGIENERWPDMNNPDAVSYTHLDVYKRQVIRLNRHHRSTKRINARVIISRHRTARRITLHTVQQRAIHRMGARNAVTVVPEGMYSTITVSAGQQTTSSIIGRGLSLIHIGISRV